MNAGASPLLGSPTISPAEFFELQWTMKPTVDELTEAQFLSEFSFLFVVNDQQTLRLWGGNWKSHLLTHFTIGQEIGNKSHIHFKKETQFSPRNRLVRASVFVSVDKELLRQCISIAPLFGLLHE